MVAIENNSSQSYAEHIARVIVKIIKRCKGSSFLNVLFTHRVINNADIVKHGARSSRDFGTRSIVGHWLGNHKSHCCEMFKTDFNKRKIRASMTIKSHTLNGHSITPNALVVDQLKKFRPDSKNGGQNDVAIAVIMAYSLMLERNNKQIIGLIKAMTC